MNSRTPGPYGAHPWGVTANCKTPGPTGKNDYADPTAWLRGGPSIVEDFLREILSTFRKSVEMLTGDTPGSLGVNDHSARLCQPSTIELPGGVVVPSAGRPVAAGPLEVAEGQVTFDAEGQEAASSPYFSRKVHWPGNAESGVTIGRGYDMGNRSKTEVQTDLISAGLVLSKAQAFAEGAGKKGSHAKKFVDDNRESLGEISQEVQKKLFENIYPSYVARAQVNYNSWTVDSGGAPLPGKVEWDLLHWAIRDILVDFVYQGFTKGPNPMVKGMRNDFDELIAYIKGNATLQQYEEGRGRVKYLEANRGPGPVTG
jgi:hypothetical protein